MPVQDYIPTIGLEVHCQIRSNSKMFCACATSYGDASNTHVCPVCLGLPGALPVLNDFAIERTILTGLLLQCKIPTEVCWDRKNYFYPDMPKNYQLTQLDYPLCLGGYVPLYNLSYHKEDQKSIATPNKEVQLNRIHLEEDVAKSTHLSQFSTIDYNRAGTPLMEIVTEPDIDSAAEAYAYLKSLQQILIYSGVSNADMEKGEMRCDVNISLRPKETDTLGEKLEIKNLNSISAVRQAILYEIIRQADELDQGIPQRQATLRWDPQLGETAIMRFKENAADYRYFREPDLPKVNTQSYVQKITPTLPELPHHKQQRFQNKFDINEYDAFVIASELTTANYFEKTATIKPQLGKKIANWILNIILAKSNEHGVHLDSIPITSELLVELITTVENGDISQNQGKAVLDLLWQQPETSIAVACQQLNFKKVDTAELDDFIVSVIQNNPAKIEEYQAGNEKIINWLTGQVMKLSKGQANAKVVMTKLAEKLSS